MDFLELKNKATKLKDSAVKASKSAVEFSASKLADSQMTLRNVKDLELFIEKSKSTSITDSTTGKEKTFQHQVIVIFADTKSEFFKQMLYALPVLSTKAYSQNIAVRLADISMKGLDKKTYKITTWETLVVLEGEKVTKVVAGNESIQKIVKSMSLDITKSIDELD